MKRRTDIAGRLAVEYLALSTVAKWPRNPKLHSPAIEVSIERFGFNDPLALNMHPDATHLLEGHGRVKALETLKAGGGEPPEHVVADGDEWLVPVVRLNLPPGEAEAYALAHNQINIAGDHDLGNWDEGLTELLGEMAGMDIDLDGLGWEPEAIRDLLGLKPSEVKSPPIQRDRAAELLAKWGCESGQIWLAGRHRLACCSNDNAALTSSLLDGTAIDLVVTDPPYDMAAGSIRKALSRFARRAVVMSGQGQSYDLPHNEWCAEAHLVWVHSTPRSTILMAMPVLYHNDILVMRSGSVKLGFARSRPDFGSVIGDGSGGFVNFGFGQGKSEYPFVEMLQCFEDVKTVADPYLGSGAVLLACEHVGKTCYGTELSPERFAVCLERLDNAGLAPRKL